MDFVDGSGLWVVSDTLEEPPPPPVEPHWDMRSDGRRMFVFFLFVMDILRRFHA